MQVEGQRRKVSKVMNGGGVVVVHQVKQIRKGSII